LEVTLQFAADIFADKSLFKLFNVVHERVQNCCGFDQQYIPTISDIHSLEIDKSLCVALISGHDFSGLKPIKQKVRDSTAAFNMKSESLKDTQVASNKTVAADED
jgi:hypothetical protein